MSHVRAPPPRPTFALPAKRKNIHVEVSDDAAGRRVCLTPLPLLLRRRYSTATRRSSWSSPPPSLATPPPCPTSMAVRPPRPATRARTNTRPSVVSSSSTRATDAHPHSPRAVADAKSQRVGLIEADIAEAEALIRRMDLEARSLQNPAVKTPLMSKLRDYKAEMQRLKRESAVAAKAANAAADRSQLLAGAQLDDMNAPTSQSQRDRMLQTTARLDQTGERIREGKRSLLETEELGVSILQDLHRQRETITNARESIHGADDNIGRSRKILAAMGRRAMANKLMMYGIIAMLATAICVIAYFKLIK